MLTTYFTHWRQSPDKILADLAHRFLDRKPLKSVEYDEATQALLPQLRQLIRSVGFNTDYYTATDNSYDLPYDDAYDPRITHPLTQIELQEPDGTLLELSTVSDLVNAIRGKFTGDQRFFFPKELLNPGDDAPEIFQPIYDEFSSYIQNNQLIQPK